MISVIIPEARATADVATMIQLARRHPHVGEILVVDDGRVNGLSKCARELGAWVHPALVLGRGAAMERGAKAAQGDIVLYLAGSPDGLHCDCVDRMIAPLECGWADFVKAKSSTSSGNLMTTILRPLLATFFPEIASFEEPLSGTVAIRRSLLRTTELDMTPGVDVGLLIDAAMSDATLAEADIGDPEPCEFAWASLPELSGQLLRTVLGRARRYRRLPAAAADALREVPQRIAVALSLTLDEPPAVAGLAIFIAEGVLFRDSCSLALARRMGCELQLAGILGDASLSAGDRALRTASLLRSIPREVVRDMANHMPLTPGAQQAVLELKQAGYRVGVVSIDSPEAADIASQRVGADFAVNVPFGWNRSGAEETASSVEAPVPAEGCCGMRDCLRPLLLALCERFAVDLHQVVVVGSREHDSCLLKAAGHSIAFEPVTDTVRKAAKYVLRDDLSTIPALLSHGSGAAPSAACFSSDIHS